MYNLQNEKKENYFLYNNLIVRFVGTPLFNASFVCYICLSFFFFTLILAFPVKLPGIGNAPEKPTYLLDLDLQKWVAITDLKDHDVSTSLLCCSCSYRCEVPAQLLVCCELQSFIFLCFYIAIHNVRSFKIIFTKIISYQKPIQCKMTIPRK